MPKEVEYRKNEYDESRRTNGWEESNENSFPGRASIIASDINNNIGAFVRWL